MKLWPSAGECVRQYRTFLKMKWWDKCADLSAILGAFALVGTLFLKPDGLYLWERFAIFLSSCLAVILVVARFLRGLWGAAQGIPASRGGKSPDKGGMRVLLALFFLMMFVYLLSAIDDSRRHGVGADPFAWRFLGFYFALFTGQLSEYTQARCWNLDLD